MARRGTNTYELDDKVFHSIKELSNYSGVHEKTITARLKRGLSVKEACKKTDLRCTYYPYKGDEKAITHICRDQEKDCWLVRNRLNYGYSLNDALNKPKKITRQGQPIIVFGILYNSVSAACRKLGLEDREITIRSRLRAGKSPDEAFTFMD